MPCLKNLRLLQPPGRASYPHEESGWMRPGRDDSWRFLAPLFSSDVMGQFTIHENIGNVEIEHVWEVGREHGFLWISDLCENGTGEETGKV